jgi:hypothetical protein
VLREKLEKGTEGAKYRKTKIKKNKLYKEKDRKAE